MDFSGGKLMETGEELPFPMMAVVKEERGDFDEEEKKGETPRRGRTRSLSKKSADKVDIKAKLERSRQSARECRARKKLRYQYLEEIISETEKAIGALRREFDYFRLWAKDLDEGRIPNQLVEYRKAYMERKGEAGTGRGISMATDVLMEEQPDMSSFVQHPVSSSPASSGIASASTSAGAMAFSPTSSAFAAMMLNPSTSTMTHNLSPS